MSFRDAVEFVARSNDRCYGPNSVFTAEEQAAMKRGYTTAERLAMSGRLYGIYPQAISEAHARKLDALNRELSA